jgi:hypothetical protein
MTRTFDADEMLAIREQYEERIAEVEARREELEWEVRRVLAVVRDAELRARSAADEIERVYGALRRLVEGGAAEAVTPSSLSSASSGRAAVSGVIAPKAAPVAAKPAVAPKPLAPVAPVAPVAPKPLAPLASPSFVASKTAALLDDDDITEIRAPDEERTALEAPAARDHDITAVDAAAPPAPKLVGKKVDETPVKVVRRRAAAAPPPIPAAASPSAPQTPSLRSAVPAPRRSSFDDANTDVMGVRPAPVAKPAASSLAAAAPKPATAPAAPPANGKPLLGYRRLVA